VDSEREALVALLVTVTVQLGIMAPDLSVIVPEILARFVWACMDSRGKTPNSSKTDPRNRSVRISSLSEWIGDRGIIPGLDGRICNDFRI
jgi:hypothetical protein